MNISIIKKLDTLLKRYKQIQFMLTKLDNISNRDIFRSLSKEYVQLSSVCNCFIDWKNNEKNILDAKLLLKDNEMYKLAHEDLLISLSRKSIIEQKLQYFLLPKDPLDELSCFIEIRAGTGGNEAAIFAGDLFRMYTRYSELNYWKVKIMNKSEGDKGGFKEIIIKVTGKGASGNLKFESGGHRVQRVPQTESQGRIHTSTCTVAVMPEIPKIERINIINSDLKIDTFRSSGAGGQHVNTTDSAIRITHLPTGHVVECQDERSQHKNKSKALSILASRIHAAELNKKRMENASMRRNLLGTGDRSDRNRTYNFPQNRITDHRINLTLYCLEEVLQGKMDVLINPIIQEHQADLLASLSD
ncbi:peptide chain release factor 1 [Buchnera aphidicola (Neophyllaphis varicolor)]|uniref:peptide chain release factor 1 n=1 Tax=Buchnera aphidicola TaxID=9 RepID=UPI0031B85B40